MTYDFINHADEPECPHGTEHPGDCEQCQADEDSYWDGVAEDRAEGREDY